MDVFTRFLVEDAVFASRFFLSAIGLSIPIQLVWWLKGSRVPFSDRYRSSLFFAPASASFSSDTE